MQLLPSPSSDRARLFSLAAKREFPESILDDTRQPCPVHQTCFWSSLHTLVPYSEERLISKGKNESSLGLLSKKSTGISTAAHHHATKFPHSFSSTSLSLTIPHTPTVRGLNMASSPFSTEAMWVSAPASGGTQGLLTPSESLEHSQPPATHPVCQSTFNAEGTPVSVA